MFIFQRTAVLSQSVNTKVILSGGVQAKNVIWQNAGNVKIQAGAFMGVLFCVSQTLLLRLGPREWCSRHRPLLPFRRRLSQRLVCVMDRPTSPSLRSLELT
jgi:hypothetical protein